jgi:hypothetical protein
MVGDFTEEQTRKVKKMHEIRVQRVRDVFDFYRLNNCLYASVTPNDAVLNEMIDSERIAQLQVDYIEDEWGAIQDEMSAEQENIRGHSDDWHAANKDDELNVVKKEKWFVWRVMGVAIARAWT